LFTLAIGGYGLFGIIATVTLRLVRRQKVERVVEIVEVDRLMPAFDVRIAAGFLYGDWQFATDPAAAEFLGRGVFSCYRPGRSRDPISEAPRLTIDDWRNRCAWRTPTRRRRGLCSATTSPPRAMLVRSHAAVGLYRRLSPRTRSGAERASRRAR
jgi:FAD/FMN-containing dehydrogenase